MKFLPFIVCLLFSLAGQRPPENELASAQVPAPHLPFATAATGNGIVYFSMDQGANWEDHSYGLPENLNLTDLAVADSLLLLSTKQNGVFYYDFRKNAWQHLPASPPTSSNLDVLNIYHGKILVGSQNDGLFMSQDGGRSWSKYNSGLQNLTIRRIAVLNDQLWLGTNTGAYRLDETKDIWIPVFSSSNLQVNGIAGLHGAVYLGTNQGVFKSNAEQTDWKMVLPNRSLHNLSADEKAVYAMVYNELYVSTDDGLTWRSLQSGLPDKLYTFQLRNYNEQLFAAQWDGVYRSDNHTTWLKSSQGLPAKMPVTELVVFNQMLVAASSGRSNN